MKEDWLPDFHDCIKECCTPDKHYGRSALGTCLVCGGCGDPECCGSCDSDCFPPD